LSAKRFIAIAGNIGVGKSTLTALLSERLGWKPFFEAVDENPYLADFYQDMERWSFHSQIFFLSRRLQHLRQILDYAGSAIQDRTVYEDAEVFAQNLARQGNMTEREYRSYCELYEAMIPFIPPPDLLVYLQASLPKLLHQINQRDRAYEKAIDPLYLQQLNDLYDAWIEGFTHCPVLTVPADNMDFLNHPEHLDLLVAKIMDKLQGREIVVFP